jgi:hypothetical protein
MDEIFSRGGFDYGKDNHKGRKESTKRVGASIANSVPCKELWTELKKDNTI